MKKAIPIFAVVLLIVSGAFLMFYPDRQKYSGEIIIYQEEISHLMQASQTIAEMKGEKSGILSEQGAREELIKREMIKQLIRQEGFEVSDEELQQIAAQQEESYRMLEEAMKASETERQYAEKTMNNMEAMAKAYGMTLEEYQEYSVEMTAFTVAKKRLLKEKFGSDENKMEQYLEQHWDEFHITVS